MTGFFRRTIAIGSSILIMMGTLGPIAARAGTSPGVNPTGQSGSPASPSMSTSYELAPEQFSLTISPARLAVSAADIARTQQFLVVNQGRAVVAVTVEKRNFTANLAGTMVYVPNAPWAAASWVTTTPNKFSVQPGKAQIVTAAIRVPSTPEVGDHQVALVFLTPAAPTGANIKINRGVAAPIFITAPGPTVQTATVTNLVASHFVSGGPVTISATVNNTGTVHRDFRGKTRLDVVAAGGSTHFPDFTVPRGTSRSISATWDPPFMCICHPSVTVVNADGSPSSVSMQIIVFPWQISLIALAALGILVLVVALARRRYRTNVRKAAHRLTESYAGGSA